MGIPAKKTVTTIRQMKAAGRKIVMITAYDATFAKLASAYIAARRALAGFADGLRAELKPAGLFVTLVVLGTVETPYWEHNPGSRENMPKSDPRLMPILTPEQAATALFNGAEQKKPTVVKPAIYRALFVMNALFPKLVAKQLRRAAKKARATAS